MAKANWDETRAERIEKIRVALLDLAIENPRQAYTLKELSEKTGIPYGSIRNVLEHRDCWGVIDWTSKSVPVREPNYGGVKCFRSCSAVMCDRWVLSNEIRRLRMEHEPVLPDTEVTS